MVYTSLTEAPHNLKEAVDWLVALKGIDAGKNLRAIGGAVHTFLLDKPVGKTEVPALEAVKLITKEFLEKPRLQAMWYVKDILDKFDSHMFWYNIRILQNELACHVDVDKVGDRPLLINHVLAM